MAPIRLETRAVAEFQCLGEACPDTCCVGWGMQLTQENVDRIRRDAPALLDDIVGGEAEFVMKRNLATDACVKLEAGRCAMQRDYGEQMLGDACYFFPRVTRALGSTIYTTAVLSCPEIARMMLTSADAFAVMPRQEVRVPYQLKNYLPPELGADAALSIHQMFVDAVGSVDYSAEHHLLRVSAVVQALALQPVAQWQDAARFYFSIADSRIPAAELHAGDPFNLVHALYGLAHASTRVSPRLMALIGGMAKALSMQFDTQRHKIHLSEHSAAKAKALVAHSRAQSHYVQPMLRRYVQAQLSQALFPFAGLGHTLSERMSIMGVRLATVKLALATLPMRPSEEEVVEVVQTVSRFMDHLASPKLMLEMYGETGWVREPRLRALLDA